MDIVFFEEKKDEIRIWKGEDIYELYTYNKRVQIIESIIDYITKLINIQCENCLIINKLHFKTSLPEIENIHTTIFRSVEDYFKEL